MVALFALAATARAEQAPPASLAGLGIQYTIVNLPPFRLHEAGVARGSSDRVALSWSGQSCQDTDVATGGGVRADDGTAGGFARVRLFCTTGATGGAYRGQGEGAGEGAGVPHPGDAYDVFLSFFFKRTSAPAAANPVRAGAWRALLAGF